MPAPNSWTFANRDGTFFNETGGQNVPVTAAPVTGATVQIGAGTSVYQLNPAGTLATLTVKLPASPANGDSVTVVSTQIVTALTLTDAAAGAVTGAPTALAAAVAVEFRRIAGAWQRMR